jgi:magnesium transporter
MIRTMLYDPTSGEIRWGDEGLLSEWEPQGPGWIWADLDAEEPAREANLFSRHFGFDPLVIGDAQRDRHPPKLETFDGYFFLLLNGLDADTRDIEFRTIQLGLFVGQRFLVTRRKARSVSIDNAWREADAGYLKVVPGPAHVAYRITRLVTDRYTHIVVGLERRLEELEDEMFENPRDAVLEELLSYNQNLLKLRRVFTYHQDIFARLSRKDHPFISKRGRHQFTDVYEHTERLASLSHLYKELADDLMHGYISVNSHRLNQIMKVLTVVTAIFLPLTLLVGIYGMNFEEMPELKVHNAYFVLLGVMAAIVVGQLALFRKLKWL